MNDPDLTKYLKYLFTFCLAGAIFLIGFLSGRVDFVQIGDLSDDGSAQQILVGDLTGKVINVDANVIWEAWRHLEETYIDRDLNKQEMIYGAVEGLVESLGDPYTQFLTPRETTTYNEGNGSKFEGIGAILRFDGEYTIIDSPIDGFPAQQSGLMPGDIILEVNGEDVVGVGSFEVAEKIKGPAGSDVVIKIFRVSGNEELEFTITRQRIDIDNVKLKNFDRNIAHIKLTKFNESDSQEFIRQWDDVVRQINEKSPEGIIVDLRNNPGGLVSLVKYVSEEFLSKGQMIMMEEERNGKRTEFKATRDGNFRNKKIVVLVNQGSASASEILAGALKDNVVATIIGMPTVGKGVEQRLVELSDGSTMHIVFRRWLTPSGAQVSSDSPIIPDIEVDLTTEDFQSGRDPQLDKAYDFFRK